MNNGVSSNNKQKNPWLMPVVTVASVLVVVLGGFLSLSLLSPNDVIAKNIYAQDLYLGGMTQEEAQIAIEQNTNPDNLEIELENNGHTRVIRSADIALSVNAAETAKKAFEIGKSGSIFKQSYDQLCLLFKKKDIGRVPQLDEAALDAILYDFGNSINGTATEPQVTFAEDIVTIVPGTPGQSRDVEETKNQVIRALTAGDYTNIPVTFKTNEPNAFTKDSLMAMLPTEAVNARFEYGPNDVTVVEHVVGCVVDPAELNGAIEKLNTGNSAIIPVTLMYPEVTTEMLEEKLFNTTLASYSTTFSTAAANRASNVALAASKINDLILAPGAEFSYAETIGNPSLANGFKVAPVYENGKTSQGVGGGVCQVSSTLYSAVLYADLEVTSRQNHSLTVAYLPKGQDATFAYGAIDFKFKNNMEYPVKISAGTKGGTLTVAIIGTQRDVEHTVQLSHAVVSTTSPTVKEQADPTLPAGTKKVVSTGKTGYVVDTTKTVSENGKVVSSKVITRSTYRMVPTEVLVGTKADETSTPVVEIPDSGTVVDPAQGTEPAVTPGAQDTPESPAPIEPTPVPPVESTPSEVELPVDEYVSW